MTEPQYRKSCRPSAYSARAAGSGGPAPAPARRRGSRPGDRTRGPAECRAACRHRRRRHHRARRRGEGRHRPEQPRPGGGEQQRAEAPHRPAPGRQIDRWATLGRHERRDHGSSDRSVWRVRARLASGARAGIAGRGPSTTTPTRPAPSPLPAASTRSTSDRSTRHRRTPWTSPGGGSGAPEGVSRRAWWSSGRWSGRAPGRPRTTAPSTSATRPSSNEPPGSWAPKRLRQEHRAQPLAHPLEREERGDLLHPGGQAGEDEEHAGDELQHQGDRGDHRRARCGRCGPATRTRCRTACRR